MSYFMFPFLIFSGPLARKVAEQGGDCADRSRSLSSCCPRVSAKMDSLQKRRSARHSIIEVNTERQDGRRPPVWPLSQPPAAVTVSPNPEPAGVRERRGNGGEHQEPLAHKSRDPVNGITYAYAKTMNWSKSAVTRSLYRVLSSTLGKQADDLRRPVWPEEPALVITFGIGFLQVLLLFGLFMVRRAAVKHSEPFRQEARLMSSSAASSLPA
jgi:hypothetical protein